MLFALVGLATLGVFGLPIALASPEDGSGACTVMQFGGGLLCGGSYVVQTPATPPPTSAPASPIAHDTGLAGNPPPAIPVYPNVAIGPNGPCEATGPNQGTILNIQSVWVAGVVLPSCVPAAPAGAAAPAARATPALDPAVLSIAFWRTIPLPKPNPQLPPGYAVTGLPAYLVTNGTLDPAPYDASTPLGPLTIVANATYSVDWGDGSSPIWTGPYAQEGRAYPDGNITHTYDNVGAVTITVIENWTASWRLGPDHGVLPGLQTRATIPDLPVRQLQAVITN